MPNGGTFDEGRLRLGCIGIVTLIVLGSLALWWFSRDTPTGPTVVDPGLVLSVAGTAGSPDEVIDTALAMTPNAVLLPAARAELLLDSLNRGPFDATRPVRFFTEPPRYVWDADRGVYRLLSPYVVLYTDRARDWLRDPPP